MHHADRANLAGPVVSGPAECRKGSRGLIPTVAFPGSKPQWPWICANCGKVVTPRYSHVRKGVGCPFCVGKGRDPEGNAALVRSKGFTPLEPFVNLRTPWLCQCGACGEAVRVWFTNLRKGHGCPNCTGRYPDAAKAEADMLAHGLRPLVPYPGRNNAPWPAECIARGHKVSPRLANIRNRPGTGCAYCVGSAVDPADAEKFMAGKGWEPLVKFPGVREKWRCRCRRCDNISTPTYKAAKRGHGCRFCNKQGIDYAGPGYVYVMVNPQLGAVKIGIFGRRAQRDRPAIMRPAGWKTFNILPWQTGERARLIEQAVLQHLRDDLGLRPYLTNRDMPQNGGTETFSEDDITALRLWRLVRAKSIPRGTRQPAK